MKRTLALSAFFYLCACGVIVPPPRFVHPYMGHLEVRYVPYEVANDICPFSQGARGWGCAIVRDGSCLVILVDGASEDVLRHEVAHCNGWPGEHPN